MANPRKHNDFILKVMDGQKHLKHVLTQEKINKIVQIEGRYAISKLPVCQSCERLAYWHTNGTAVCTHCGTITLKPINLAEYYINGYDLDGATGDDKSFVKLEKIARETILPNNLKK